MVSPQQAMQMLAARIQALEQKVAAYMSEMESKLGEQANFVSDNIPDMDMLNTAIGEINRRLLDVEEFEQRIAVLESASSSDGGDASPQPVVVVAPPPKAAKKKGGGTVKLSD
jgi:tetrahydromethanopterin S-methyltransferase subunit G